MSYLSRTVLLVLSKINVILTVRQIILSHPLTVVLSSLGSNLYNSHCAAKINGEPLVSIVVARAPCSHPGPCSPEKEPSIVGWVVFVPAWGSSNPCGSYATILHSQWFVTLWTLKRKRELSLILGGQLIRSITARWNVTFHVIFADCLRRSTMAQMLWNLSLKKRSNSPRSLYLNCNMTPRLSGYISIFGLVFFVTKSLLGIARQWTREKLAILSLKPWSHVRILINPTWAITKIAFDVHFKILVREVLKSIHRYANLCLWHFTHLQCSHRIPPALISNFARWQGWS